MTGRERAIRAVVALGVTIAGVVALGYLLPVAAASWIKALHVMAVISWMAGMLYLPRLFVYHCAATPGSETSETFKVMERRLLEYIINPAMIVSWSPDSGSPGWSSASRAAGCTASSPW